MNNVLLITDMHIAKNGLNGIDTITAFKNVLRHSNKNIKADSLILCGDLAQDGFESDYQIMCALIHQYYPNIPTYTIAGNHDNQENLAKIVDQQDNIIYLDNKKIDTENHQIIFLNSNLQNKTEGYLATKTLTWLKDILHTTNKQVYIFLHHHTVPIGLKIDKYILKNREEFITLLQLYKNKIKSVICGHTHNFTQQEIAGISFITLPSASMQYLSKTQFMPENKQMYSLLNLLNNNLTVYSV